MLPPCRLLTSPVHPARARGVHRRAGVVARLLPASVDAADGAGGLDLGALAAQRRARRLLPLEDLLAHAQLLPHHRLLLHGDVLLADGDVVRDLLEGVVLGALLLAHGHSLDADHLAGHRDGDLLLLGDDLLAYVDLADLLHVLAGDDLLLRERYADLLRLAERVRLADERRLAVS